MQGEFKCTTLGDSKYKYTLSILKLKGVLTLITGLLFSELPRTNGKDGTLMCLSST